ncbi:MAG: glycosyltransferase family 4 protein [Chloroflexota bacterium]|nr:glycosyltransferase family 4 protein [Chloroflexota bacterium]
MRVIHVAPTAFGSAGVYGGGERYPLELARALSRRIDCTLVTFGPVERDYRDGRLRVRVVKPLSYLGGHPARPLAPSMPRLLRGADVVHAHHLRSPASAWAAFGARARGMATGVTDHGLQGWDGRGLLHRLFDHFLLVSRYSAGELGAPAGRTSVIYGGADTERYWPDDRVSRRGVLFVGRVTPHKGIDRLIGALPYGATLTLAGSSGHDPRLPERDYPVLLRQLAAGRDVRFAGPVSDEDLPALYRRAEVVVLPSVEVTCYGRAVAVSELLGLVLLEAMASGTPVVASRLGGIPEIVDDGATGHIVTPGDEGELHDALAGLLGDPARARRIGTRARERVLEEFTWERCADRCLAAYAELVKSR